MGQRIGLLILGLAGTLYAGGALALGLGDIELKSHLNQRLEAEIELLEVRDLSQEEILIGLGSVEDFERQGIERTYFLTDIEFYVDLDANGGPVVKLSSSRPVREPFLDFIIEARWPSGKLLREYTLLLDLPLFSDEAAAPVSPVQTETVTEQSTSPAPRTSTTTSSAPKYNPRSEFGQQSAPATSTSTSTVASGPAYEGDDYQVRRNDTLWEIALNVRPERSVSVHQTMMALHRANPDAFINGNINLLKSGQILRVPDVDEIRALNQRQAVQEVAQHNADWNSNDTAAPLDASRAAYSENTQQREGEGRLSLSSPDDSFDAAGGRIGGSASGGDAETAALERELETTLETLDQVRGENSEYRNKIASLEDQIKTLESMIEVSSESLRALELASTQNNESVTVDEVEVFADEEAAAVEEGSDALAESLAEEIDELDLGAETAESDVIPLPETTPTPVATPEPKKVDPTKVVSSAPAKQPGLLDFVMEYIVFIGLGLIAVLAAIFFLLKRRNDDDDDFDDFLNDDTSFDEEGFDALAEPEESQDDSEDFDAVAEDSSIEESVELPEESPEPETEDVVAESDIYIAYGKYDQAEEMLQKALQREPQHHEARLKLLEIYAAQGNQESFDPHYATLRAASRDDALIARAAALREGIPGVGEFDESLFDTSGVEATAAAEPVAEEEAVDPLDLDLDIDEPSADTELDLKALDSDESLSDSDALDLELDLDSGSDDSVLSLDEPESELELDLGKLEEEQPAPSADNSLDFDLEGLDFDDDALESDGESISLDIEESEVELADSDALDLDLDIEAETEAQPVEDLDLDFDLGDLEETSPEKADDNLLSGLETEAPSDELVSLDTETEELGASLSDELEMDLESIDLELGTTETEVEGESTAEDLGGLDLETDFGDFELEDDDGSKDLAGEDLELDLLDTELDEPAEDKPLSEEPASTLEDRTEDDTLIREAPSLESVEAETEDDDLSVTGTGFDLAALDEELDALTSDLEPGDFSDEAIDRALDLDDELPSLDEELSAAGEDPLDSLELEPEEDAMSLTSDSSLDTDIDLDDLELSPAAELEEPDLSFDDLDEALDDPAPAPVVESLEEISLEEEPDTLGDTDLDDMLSLDEDASTEESEAEVPDLLEEAQPEPSPVSLDDEPVTLAEEAPLESPASAEPEDSSNDLSEDALDFELPDIDPDASDDEDLDFLSDSDETATKLDLAAAYIDMGDASGAKEIIDEILKEGNESQQAEARSLLDRIGG